VELLRTARLEGNGEKHPRPERLDRIAAQNKRLNWDTCQIGIPGATAKDRENRRIPFNPQGRLAAVLKRRADLGADAYVFGSTNGGYQTG
jgi:hypothetical protein